MTMWDFLQWVFYDFWRWLGLMFVLGSVLGGIARIIRALNGDDADE